ARLFGLEDEAAALVQVDAQGGGEALRLAAADAALEHVVVLGRRVAGRVRARQVQRPAQLGQEHLIVGAFGAAARLAPAGDEGLDVHARPPCGDFPRFGVEGQSRIAVWRRPGGQGRPADLSDGAAVRAEPGTGGASASLAEEGSGWSEGDARPLTLDRKSTRLNSS